MSLKPSKHIAQVDRSTYLDHLDGIFDNKSIDIIIILPDIGCQTDEDQFSDNDVVIDNVFDVPLDVCGFIEILTGPNGDNFSKRNTCK